MGIIGASIAIIAVIAKVILQTVGPHISDINKQVWFREWAGSKQSIEQVADRSSYSVRHLKSYIHSQLPKCPTWHIQRREKVNLLIDGTYFPK